LNKRRTTTSGCLVALVAALVVSVTLAAQLAACAPKIVVSRTSPLHDLIEDCLPDYYGPNEDPLAKPEMKKQSPGVVKLGWEHFNRGDYQTALKRFLMGIRHDSTNAKAYFGVAYVCSVQGNLTDAITFYREALKYEKHYAPIYANLAKALLIQNPYASEAPKLLDEALKVDPRDANALYTYAGYYATTGNWKAAGEMANKAVASGAKLDPAFLQQLKGHGVQVLE
jgi:Tfp pilus assembly protein PilF